jgi:regulator of sigma D
MDLQQRRIKGQVARRGSKAARMAVSKQLALYHQSLVDALSSDAASFFDRVMEEAERNISARREQRDLLQYNS